MKKGDYMVMGLVLILAVFFFIFDNALKTDDFDQKKVRISINNELYREIPFDNTTTETITIENDYGYNLIQIENQKVWIVDADCPDKICVKDGSIEDPGDILVCLPHKLVIEIIGTQSDEVDEISY